MSSSHPYLPSGYLLTELIKIVLQRLISERDGKVQQQGSLAGDLSSETEDDSKGEDIEEEDDEPEGQGQAEEGLEVGGQGRYPSRSRARVEHYNPSLVEQQHMSKRRTAAVRAVDGKRAMPSSTYCSMLHNSSRFQFQ